MLGYIILVVSSLLLVSIIITSSMILHQIITKRYTVYNQMYLQYLEQKYRVQQKILESKKDGK